MIEYIQGDLLTVDAELIAHQINSLAVKAHGLSAAIAKKFPWADRYSQREAMKDRNLAIPYWRDRPGSIVILRPPDDDGPVVACLVGQYDMGLPGRYKRLPDSEKDTKVQREIWFKECLGELTWYVGWANIKSVAFPDRIGCGLAGGNWTVYSKMIEDFAQNVPDTVVQIVQLK